MWEHLHYMWWPGYKFRNVINFSHIEVKVFCFLYLIVIIVHSIAWSSKSFDFVVSPNAYVK